MTPATESAIVADAVARYLAAGGTIHRRDIITTEDGIKAVEYRVDGAGKIVGTIAGFDMLTDTGKSEPVRANMTAAERQAESKRRQAENKAKNAKRVSRVIEVAVSASLKARRIKRDARLSKLLQIMAPDWSYANLRAAAQAENRSIKKVREFLRHCGYGDRLPICMGADGKPRALNLTGKPVDNSERDAGVVRDYLTSELSLMQIGEKYGIAERTVRRIAKDAGADRGRGKTGGSRLRDARDQRIAEMYLAGASTCAVSDAVGVNRTTVIAALKRMGVRIRSAEEAQLVRFAPDENGDRRRRVVALHLAGHPAAKIAADVGYKSMRSVHQIIAKWRQLQPKEAAE